jgi:DNA recombination-dependent growth factor C
VYIFQGGGILEYSVGEVIYLLLNRDKKVIPVRVVEQIVRKTIDGEDTSYVVELPNEDKRRVSLEKIDGTTYRTPVEVRDIMISNATTVIDQIILNATKVSKDVFGEVVAHNEDSSDEDMLSDSDKTEDEGSLVIDLGNGLKGRINSSEIQ